MSIALGPGLFFDWEGASLRDTLASVAKTVRVIEDAAVFPGGLPGWQSCVLGTYSYPSSNPFFGGNGVGQHKITTASAAGSRGILRATNAGRTFADGATTSGSSVITSSTATFGPGDRGRPISGAGIPANSVVVGVLDSATIAISQAATATATAVSVTLGVSGNAVHVIEPANFKAIAWTIEGLLFDADGGYDVYHGFFPQSGSPVYGGAGFQATNGSVGGWAQFVDPTGAAVNLPRLVTGTVTAGSTAITLTSGAFASTDAGQPIGNFTGNQSPPVPLIAGCTVASVTDATHAVLSLPATLSGTQQFAVGQQPYFRPFSTNGGGRWRKNFTTLWLPQAGYLYLLRGDQVVSEVNLNPYYGTGTGQLDITRQVSAQTQITAQDGVAHSFAWDRTELILAHD